MSVSAEQLSIDLLKDPYSLDKWTEFFVKSPLFKRITKLTSELDLETIRQVYSNFLNIFPLLEKYYLRFIDVEYKLGNFGQCEEIYNMGFRYLSYSVYFWMKYLHYKIDTTAISVHRVEELYSMFETARGFIGHQYHSFEFYKLYLDFLHSYKDLNPKLRFSESYEALLLSVLEIPLYNYSYFHKLSLELEAKGKHFKKQLVETYTITQQKTFVLYDFEKKLTNYWDVEYVSVNELKCWESYVDHVQANYLHQYTTQLFERALIRTASYPNIASKYISYLTKCSKLGHVNELLKRLISINPYNKELLDSLFDVSLQLGNKVALKTILTHYQHHSQLVKLDQNIKHYIETTGDWEKLLYFNVDQEELLRNGDDSESYKKTLEKWLFYHPDKKDQFGVTEETFDEELRKLL